MQVVITCPDSGFIDVVFTATAESLVKDALNTAGEEWNVDTDFLEMSFGGTRLPMASLILSHGVESDSVLEVSEVILFGKEWFDDSDERKNNLLKEKYQNKTLHFDTPTFTIDGCLGLDQFLMKKASSISFSNPDCSVTSVGDSYLFPLPFKAVEIPGLCNVTSIGSSFLSRSPITAIDLSILRNVTSIGKGFVSSCLGITKLDLSGLVSVTSIETGFLTRCTSITTLDLSTLTNTTVVGSYFLSHNLSMISLNISGLINVTDVGDHFVSSCPLLKDLDLSGLSNVTSIGKYFLSNNSSIAGLVLSQLRNVNSVGDFFLKGCSSSTISPDDIKEFLETVRIQ